ncbi:MAG: hypothetical protein PHN84_07760 [Desulfuromonadaceae bacterium]|nr:hypothetical protein [Desulfuromonadaceae bacterium]MDD2856693.1 hypothetical protein [Desulfuromonadaceae bacterium]
MRSDSTLVINWFKPDIEDERWEFFNHPAKQEWYLNYSVTWEQIVSCFKSGTLCKYPRSSKIGEIPVALSYHSYEEYQTWLAKAKRGYRKSYSKMEDALQAAGELNLPAPIILVHNGDAILFSGYRRLCLAWNYGMIPYVWLVEI